VPTTADWQRWGIDPSWSRFVDVPGTDGVSHRWHVLDSGTPPDARGTIVCVHGNPTWSFAWRSFFTQLRDRYRVIAVDQLGMGLSERTSRRRFAQRVDDLDAAIAALDVVGPVVTAAHDWGGPISLGWVLRHRERVAGVVLCNTGVAVPAGRQAPWLIRLAAAGPLRDLVCRRTRLFVDGTVWLSGRRLDRAARDGLCAPYRRAGSRHAIAEFVGDVPFDDSHPSASAIAEVAEGIRTLTMPVLLGWGNADPVFNDDFAHDLAQRMPHADLHRFPGMGHLVVEETADQANSVAATVDRWLNAHHSTVATADTAPAERVDPTPATHAIARPIWSAIVDHATDPATAFVDGATRRVTTFAEFHDRVMGIASGLAAQGVSPGDRIAVLVPPGVDLLATAYACWRAGAVTVIADRGLGLRGLGAAVRGGRATWVIGPPRALAAARALRWTQRARFIAVGGRRVFGAVATLDQLAEVGAATLPPEPAPADLAAVLYTSGATGPAKGVRYLHGQMASQRDALMALYGINPSDRLVAAFAPFALYGPAMGICSTIPHVDVTAPGSLTADALGTAVESVAATIVFASPAALANVIRTAPAEGDQRLAALRLVLSAGAPVPIATLRAMAQLTPRAELHTPYGMTECLPVADIELADIEEALASSTGRGVCVGAPVDAADVVIAPLGFDASVWPVSLAAGATGEIVVRTPWMSAGYDQLWRTQFDARPIDAAGATWHRTGDVGHLDDAGRLWVEGRSVHVIAADGVAITPVPVEVAVERLDGIDRAAAVGVGPTGCQQLVVVIEHATGADGVAGAALCARVRASVDHPVAAVLTVGALPVDIRHNTKIDRTAVARWAGEVLSGRRAKRSW
jgi:acyl-coenzyme A synthetase/AMP-(fatty) acid ligase/pimeloyl-ACP methyl ester carboxylesterase